MPQPAHDKLLKRKKHQPAIALLDPAATATEPSEAAFLAAQAEKLSALVEDLMNVSDDEAAEPRETWQFLMRALDIDRLSNRLLFPWEWNEDACPERPASEWRVDMALPKPDAQRRPLTADEEEERRRVQREKNQAAIELRRSWREGDDEPELIEEETERRRAQREHNQAAIALLDSLMNVDEAEAEDQRETLEYLTRVLNEDRLSDRDRFPDR